MLGWAPRVSSSKNAHNELIDRSKVRGQLRGKRVAVDDVYPALKMTVTWPGTASTTRTLSGRSIPDARRANMSGVPAFGLPKTINVVGGKPKPAAEASACWSMVTKTLIPWSAKAKSRRCTVSANKKGLAMFAMPLLLAVLESDSTIRGSTRRLTRNRCI